MMRGGHGRPVLAHTKQGAFSRTTDCVTPPLHTILPSRQPLFTDFDNVPSPPGGALPDCVPQPNVTKVGAMATTTSHVITSSIDEGVDADMSDRDSDTGSVSQETSFVSGLVTTADIMSTVGSMSDSTPRLVPSNAFGDLSRISNVNTSDQSISTGIGSQFASFDSNIEADLMSSSSSCTQSGLPRTFQSAIPPRNTPATVTMTPPISTKFSHAGGRGESNNSSGDEHSQDRSQTRSPVNFREGRRASDGLLTQGVIAFRQRLKDSMRAHGMSELRQEMELLQNRYRNALTMDELIKLQQQHSAYHDRFNLRQWSLDTTSLPLTKLITKRKSLPASATPLELAPHKFLAMKHSIQIERHLESPQEGATTLPSAGTLPPSGAVTLEDPGTNVQPFGLQSYEYNTTAILPVGSKTLQQHLFQHRLQQKRQGKLPQASSQQLHQQFQQMHIDGAQQHLTQHILTGQQQQGQQQSLPHGQMLPQQAQNQAILSAQGDQTQMGPTGQSILPCQQEIIYPKLGLATGGTADAQHLIQVAMLQQQQQQGLLSGVKGCISSALYSPDLTPLQQAMMQQQAAKLAMLRRPTVVRQTSYKLAQQQPVMPPYATDDPLQWQQVGFDQQTLGTMLEEVVTEGNEEDGDTMEVSWWKCRWRCKRHRCARVNVVISELQEAHCLSRAHAYLWWSHLKGVFLFVRFLNGRCMNWVIRLCYW